MRERKIFYCKCHNCKATAWNADAIRTKYVGADGDWKTGKLCKKCYTKLGPIEAAGK